MATWRARRRRMAAYRDALSRAQLGRSGGKGGGGGGDSDEPLEIYSELVFGIGAAAAETYGAKGRLNSRRRSQGGRRRDRDAAGQGAAVDGGLLGARPRGEGHARRQEPAPSLLHSAARRRRATSARGSLRTRAVFSPRLRTATGAARAMLGALYGDPELVRQWMEVNKVAVLTRDAADAARYARSTSGARLLGLGARGGRGVRLPHLEAAALAKAEGRRCA